MRLDELAVLSDATNDGLLDAGSPRGVLAWTPLQLACALGDEPLVASLLADLTAEQIASTGKTKYSYTPLHIAIHFGHVAIAKHLLAHASATINAADAQIGATALHVAVLSGNVDVVRVLLDADVVHASTTNGTTPLDVATELGHSEIQQLLTDAIAKAAGKTQINDWLARIGLVEYAHNFSDAGFDDAAFLLAHGLSDAALDTMQIDKPGHRLKLQSLYQLRESIPALASAAASDSSDRDDDDDSEDEDESDESDESESDDETSSRDDDDDSDDSRSDSVASDSE